MAEKRKYDLVLFGATGFTGGLTADYLGKVAAARPLSWALAGRSADKLQAVRARLAVPPGSPSSPDVVVADAADPQAIGRMVEQTRTVVTTVGPFGKYGEPLARACAEIGADYVDSTGEPEFVDTCLGYHAIAERNRVKIVNACGFDSVPHDLGAYFTLQALRSRMSEAERAQAPVTIEGFVKVRGGFSGGTLHSMLEILGHVRERAARRKAEEAAARSGPRKVSLIPPRIAYRRELERWAVPMPTIDPEVVLRSAQLIDDYGPDFRYGHYLALSHAVQVGGLVAGAGGLFALAQFGPTKKLLQQIKTPGEGPSEQQRSKGFFSVTFLGRAAGHELRCEVSGGDPGYDETSKMLAESALCLAFDGGHLPPRFGVVPSAAAMGNALIERLRNAGITFREL